MRTESLEVELLNRIMASEVLPAESIIPQSIASAVIDGLILEFGVFKGASISRIRREVLGRGIDRPVYGFDWFRGLPDDWPGVFNAGWFFVGEAPAFDDDGIVIVPGLFQESLTPFLASHPGPAAFVHVDCDIYSSASYVLEMLRDRIVAGTVVLFDELIGYRTYADHEFRALVEFLDRHKRQAEILFHGPMQVAVKFVE